MKFTAVILLACVAVSSAAFTANLVQHTQPALDKAMFSARLAAGNKALANPAVSAAIDGIIAAIQNTVNTLLQNAQEALAHGQTISQALQEHLLNAVAQLQTIGGAAATQLQQVIQAFLAGIGAVGGNKASLADAIAFAQNAFQQAVALAQQLINQIDINTLLPQAINAVLPPNIAHLVIAHLGLNNKGLGDLFGTLFGNLWEQITGAAGNLAQQIAQAAQLVASLGAGAFSAVQAQASQFLSSVAAGASQLSSQAAQQILSHISSFQQALGSQYQAVVDALQGICLGGNLNCVAN